MAAINLETGRSSEPRRQQPEPVHDGNVAKRPRIEIVVPQRALCTVFDDSLSYVFKGLQRSDATLQKLWMSVARKVTDPERWEDLCFQAPHRGEPGTEMTDDYRQIFKPFLHCFPYFHGYWQTWIDYEMKKVSQKEGLKVLFILNYYTYQKYLTLLS